MTVCVAALCEQSRAIILAADREVGLPFVKGQLEGQKVRTIFLKWAVLIAGNDVAPAYDVISYAWDNFAAAKDAAGIYIETAIKCVTEAFQKRRAERAEALYLSPRGWTLDEFKQFGQQRMPLSLYLQLDAQMAACRLEITLLVAGFDDVGQGHIFTVYDPGVAVRQDAVGFQAIGSGGVNATGMLFYRRAAASMKLSKAVYCVYEAKTSGERAPGVGEETDMWIMTAGKDGEGGNYKYIGDSSRATMKHLWNKVRPKELKTNDLVALTKLSEVADYEKAKEKQEADAKAAAAAAAATKAAT
jgi:hypothetical protein